MHQHVLNFDGGRFHMLRYLCTDESGLDLVADWRQEPLLTRLYGIVDLLDVGEVKSVMAPGRGAVECQFEVRFVGTSTDHTGSVVDPVSTFSVRCVGPVTHMNSLEAGALASLN